MKSAIKLSLIFVFMLILAMPGTALAADENAPFVRGLNDEFVTGNYTLQSGDTVEGNLWVMGGNATLENGSRVTGNITLMGGNLEIDGEVDGNIIATGGNVELLDDADVRGDISLVGGSIDRDEGAQVGGDITTEPRGPLQFVVPPGVHTPNFSVIVNPWLRVAGFFLRSFLMAALAILVVMFWPRQTGRVAKTVVSTPVVAGGLGLLTIAVAPAVMLALAITIILIPVSLVIGFVLLIMVIFGWIALGLEVGQRMARMFNQEWALPVAAGLGTLLLTLVVSGVGEFIDCVGWLLPVTIGLLGLGGVLLTRFGTQPYPGFPAAHPVAPVAPVVPPTAAAVVEPVSPADASEPVWAREESDDTLVGGAAVFPVEDEPPAAPPDEPAA